MKLDKKQQERIEGWLYDCFKPCKVLDLTVTNTGINYKVEINFTTEKYGNSFDETLEKRREIYNHYSNCITVGVEENKITTTAEIANKFNRSSYKKDMDNLTTPGELLKVTKVNTEYVNSQAFRLNISFSDKISYDQACVIHDILVDYFELYTKVYYYDDRVYKAQYTIGWNIY